ncbi:META domain-containing protein [Corynebacterium sp. H128]|uniref:META domain-containing protein n=1 Tax=unclassified Corynebacterium TaxID=2624378 RepID=UPI0030AA67F5
MKKRLCALLGVVALLPTACANEASFRDTTWQIVNVYSNPNMPSELPGQAKMAFGSSTVTGYTGCGSFQGRVHFEPSAEEPEKMTFRDMNFQDVTCDGTQRYFHDELVTLLDGEFEAKREKDNLLLSKPGDVDRQGVRLLVSR